ncbi:MAG: molybdopterin molybdotransferase MoeA [Lachnospiraceae bacterium]
MNFLNTKTLTEAEILIKGHVDNYKQGVDWNEETKLMNALDRICGSDIISKEILPPFDRSTVDGYAVRRMDVQGASESIPVPLTLAGSVAMGQRSELSLGEGMCAYVPTGGMIPEGADAMVMVEDTEVIGVDTILIYRPAKAYAYITCKGEDVQIEDVLVPKGRRITSYEIAILAGMGIPILPTVKQPIFTVISTGDEIIDINETVAPGLIRDINGYGLTAWIKENGGQVRERIIVGDDWSDLESAVRNAAATSDVVLLSGGSSQGKKDYTKGLIESFADGNVMVHGLSVKPGKPTIIGSVGKTLILGLPGHPVAAMMICHELAGCFMDHWFEYDKKRIRIKARMKENIHGATGRDTLLTVRIREIDHELWAEPIYGKSGLITTLTNASGWVRISQEKEGVLTGDWVEVELLQGVRL